jgi:hypothetical protein
MIFEVNNNGAIKRINVEESVNDLFDKIEYMENKRLNDVEMRNIANAYIDMLKPYIVKVIN